MRLMDFTGTNHGCFYIIERAPSTTKQGTLWRAKCTYCGKEQILSTSNMRRNAGRCRCLSVKGNRSPYWKGCGEISGRFFSQIRRGAGGAYIRSGRRCSTRKGREHVIFAVTIEDLWDLAEKQNKRCALSGIELIFQEEGRTASLDRIDNNGNYVIENIQWVHKDVNRMKNVFSQERFIEICKLVSGQCSII